ncbi:MAG: adenylate/guanylate cyclase domain-containing protein [Bacteroidia bacterium]
MKQLSAIVFLMLFFSQAQAQDSVATFVIEQDLNSRHSLTDITERLYDPGGNLTLEQILADSSLQSRFSKTVVVDSMYQNGRYKFWSRIRISNQSEKTLQSYLNFGFADTLDIYEINNDKITHWQTGRSLDYHDKYNHNNSILLTLAPGQSKLFYCRHSSDLFYPSGLILSVYTENVLRWNKLMYFSLFVDGFQIVMLILGFMLFFIFKDRHYLLCTIPLVGFLLWFSDINGELHLLLNSPGPFIKYFNAIFTSWFMPVCIVIFYSSYVRLKKKMPWVYYTYLLLPGLIVIAVVGLIQNRWYPDISNFIILLLTVITFFSAVYMSFKGEKRARVWLLFTFPLIIGGGIHLIRLITNLQMDISSVFLMQSGALISSTILGYLMYGRVNGTIRENFRVVKANEKLVREQNVNLEKKVAERTLQLEEQARQLDLEKQKSDSILLNILPEEVAEELKETGRSQARLFENVTVLFTDFVDFTKAGERLTPQELVSELHNCFKAFDEIIQKQGLEKIKTVGDAYIAVAGLPVPVKGHAARVAKAALEIRDFMVARQKLLKDNTFQVRLGIHSGPVVAGIVGVKKFAYDIWGDTVNTAARMEQCSEAGEVNISETTYGFIKGQFECTCRGVIAAKNKGKMQMYFVKRENQANVLKAITKEVI